MRPSTLALALSGGGFLIFGLALLLAPQAVMLQIGLVVPDGAPTTEIRAFYGGLELALAGWLLAALRQGNDRMPALLLGASCYGGVALTRAIGMLVDGSGGSFLWIALLVEAALAGLCLWAWKAEGRTG